MKKILPLLLLCALPASAQQWSFGAGTGPFFFGDLVRRELRIGSEEVEIQESVLSASTRAGLTVDLERNLGDRFAVRLEGTFTRAPLGIKRGDDDAFESEAGDLDVTTFSIPIVLRLNPRGTFRFHLHGGPAYVSYRMDRDENAASNLGEFTGTRNEWGWMAGGGVGWYMSDRFAIEAQATNVNTDSPFELEEIAGPGNVELPRPNHIHGTLGIRYRF